MITPPPTPEEQLQFLYNIQRLFAQGRFTASYKYALLQSIADLCVMHGDDSGDSLEIKLDDIAEQFIHLYWQQCRPFYPHQTSQGFILRQNTSGQAAVVTHILTSQRELHLSAFKLKYDYPKDWVRLKRNVRTVVSRQPLWKLQVVSNDTNEFLYDDFTDTSHDSIRLKSGVAYCFRAFHSILTDMTRGAWLRFVQTTNTQSLGNSTDLGEFLFNWQRIPLDKFKLILRDHQETRCFYCHKMVKSKGEVDHFIPFSQSPTHLGHNYVFTHKSCNLDKFDFLAAHQHLHEWAQRNLHYGDELTDLFNEQNLPNNLPVTRNITNWAYCQAESTKAELWLRKRRVMETIQPSWREVLV